MILKFSRDEKLPNAKHEYASVAYVPEQIWLRGPKLFMITRYIAGFIYNTTEIRRELIV